MRKKNLLWGTMAAFMLEIGLGACQNDEVVTSAVTDSVEAGTNVITLNAVMGGNVESRAMIELGNDDEDAEYVQWNESDVLIVQNLGQDGTDTDGAVYKFEISSDYSDESPSKSAMFICTEAETNAISEGDVLCAFYLGNDATVDDYTNYLSLNNGVSFTSYTEDEIKEYLKDYMYMVGKTTFYESRTSLTMKQLTSMLRVTYNNATDSEQTIYEMCFSGNNSWIGTYMYHDVVNETYDIWSWEQYSYMWFNDGLKVGAYESVDLYFLCFPSYEEFTSSDFVYITIDGEELWLKTSEIPTTTFDIGYRYWFDVTKYDTGLEWTNYELIFDDYITITKGTNDALCEFLVDEIAYSYIDDDGNLQMPTDVVNSTTEIIIYNNYDIKSIAGLECFTNLETLYVCCTSVTSLDFSSFPNLYWLSCYGNSLTSLDVSNNTNLRWLNCYNNQLTSLDLSSNTNLGYLSCYNNQLTSLDLSNNTSLSTLYCFDNQLTSLDLSNNTNLGQLNCYNNQLTSLDLSNNISLTSLSCYNNQLTSLDLSNNTYLYYLYCGGNENLTEILCSGTRLYTFNFDGDTAITTLKVDGNHLSELDVSDLSNLTELTCGNQTDYWSGDSQTLTLTLYQDQYETICDTGWQSDEKNSNVVFNITE